MIRTRSFLLLVLLLSCLGGASSARDAAALDRTVEHPGGVAFACPAAWQTQASGPAVELRPPNPNPLGEPPVYKLVVLPRGELRRPDDPAVIGQMEQQSRASAPHLKRVGGVDSIAVPGGAGAILTFEGKSAAGLVERARIYIALVGDKVVFLFARSGKLVLAAHEPTLDAIFATVKAPAAASPFAGTFENDRMSVKLVARGSAFEGHIAFGGKTMPLTAKVEGGKLSGSFESGGHRFPFTAELAGNTLRLTSGGTTYDLARKGGAPAAPANPLAGAGPKPPAPAPAAVPGAPAVPEALENLGPPRPDPKREWTIAVYLDGDNDLEPFALRDLIEMEFGLPPEGIEIIVLMDRAKGFEKAAGDWTDARVYRVRPDRDPNRIASEVLASPGELNMGDAQVLATFLGAALKTFPAPNTMLVLWDHGGGWAAMASDFEAPGSKDGHDGLTLPELRAGVSAGLKKAGLERLSLIGFDMCLMAQLETAVEVADLADVMIASQAIEPGNGWPYNAILPQIGKGTLGSRRIAQEIVRAYSKFYDEKQADVATLSALDLRNLPDVVGAFEGVVAKILPAVDRHWPALSRSIFYAEAYADRTDVRRGPKALASVDLLDVVKRMRYSVEGFAGETEYRKLVDAMDRFVLASHHSPRRRLSNGLSVYAPVHGKMLDPEYAKTRMAATSKWPALLARIHAAQRAGAKKPKFGNMRVTDEKGNRLPSVEALRNDRLSFTLEGDNIIWTQVWFGKDDAGAGGMIVLSKGFVVDPLFYKRRTDAVADIVDLIMPKYVDGKNELYQDLIGLTLKVCDGSKAYEATIDASELDDPEHLRVPVLLKHPEAPEIGGTIVFDACWWQPSAVIAEIPQPDGRIMYRQIEPTKDTRVTLLFETVKPDGKIAYARGSSFLWGDGPELLLDVAAPGTYRAAFIAETIGGESAVETITFPVKESPWLARIKGDLGKFDASTLVGTWDHFMVGETYVPTGLVFEIRPHAKRKGLLVADVTSTKRKDIKIRQILWPDTRLVPSLRFFEYDDKGNRIGFYLAACGFGVREGKPTLFYKMADVTRISAALVKRGGAAAPAQPGSGGTGPAPTPQQQGIVGKWADGQGTVLVCDATRYALYSFGELIDQGRYVLRGNRLQVQSVDGETAVYQCVRSGKTLALTDEDGMRMVFQLVQ
jgi:hypothetical protein